MSARLLREGVPDDAVLREPVSAQNSLLTGKNTGKFTQFASGRQFFYQDKPDTPILPVTFPNIQNREFFRCEQGRQPRHQGNF
jgi:hypothetical protein